MRATILEPALVGRDAELARLRDRLMEAAVFGSGSVVLVAGERGTGKTRLMAEVQREAKAWGAVFLAGAGDPAHPRLPCGLFLGPLRAYLHCSACREPLQETIAQLAPHLWDSLFPHSRRPSSPAPAIDPELCQSLLLACLAHLLLELSRQQPLVLCLEDLHWADPASLQLLGQLAGKSASAPLLIAGTYRPERAAANDINLEEVVWEFCRYPHFEHLRLGRLSLAQTRVAVYSCFAQSAFSEDLVEGIYRQTGGVPLFIVQCLEELRRDGTLCQDQGRGVDRPVEGEVEAPASLRAALRQQLQGLSAQQRAILSCAAAQGEFFAGAPVAQAMGWPLVELLRELSRLERATRLVCCAARGFRFAHPLLVELCGEQLPATSPHPRGFS